MRTLGRVLKGSVFRVSDSEPYSLRSALQTPILGHTKLLFKLHHEYRPRPVYNGGIVKQGFRRIASECGVLGASCNISNVPQKTQITSRVVLVNHSWQHRRGPVTRIPDEYRELFVFLVQSFSFFSGLIPVKFCSKDKWQVQEQSTAYTG